MTDDERGILTSADRAFLRGERDLSEGSEYNTKRRIRNRVRRGLLDFTLIFDEMEHEEREKLFAGRNITPQVTLDENLEAGMRDSIAFALEGAGGVGLFKHPSLEDITARQVFENALDRLAWRYGYDLHSVTLEADAERVPRRRLREDFKEGEELSTDEFAHLLEEDEVDTAAVQDFVREMMFGNE